MSSQSQDAAREHERAAEFVRLLSRYERRINSFILSLVPNWSDADEIGQETKLRLWEQFGEYDPSRDFGAWACAVAHYMVLTHRRRVERQRVRFSDEFLAAVAEEAQASAGELEGRHRALARCLEKFGPEKTSLLRRYYAGPETARDLAGRLGRSAAAVHKEIQRLRYALAMCIQKSLGAGGMA